MDNYEQELLKRCGEAFKALTAYSYQIKIFHNSAVSDINLKFTPSDFLHLTSLEKLDGIWQTSYLDTNHISDGRRLFRKNEKILENIMKGHFSFKTVENAVNFFDDTNKSPESIENARQKGYVIRSELLSRLLALENLYIIINNSELGNENIQKPFTLKIYKWDKTARKENRPHSSKINADYLLEFQKKYDSEKPYVDFFIVGNSESCNGMSIFQSEVTYVNDTEKEKAERIKKNMPERNIRNSEIDILSVTEIKTSSETQKVIMTKSDEYIQKCQDEINEHQQIILKAIANDPNKKTREKFFSKLGNHRSQFIKKNSRLNKENYYKMVELDLFCSEFSEFDLKNLKSGMEQSMNALNTSEKKKICLEYEIATVETIIELKSMIKELEQLLQQEDFSVDAYADKLSAFSAYLSDRSVNIGKDLVMKAAELIERQKENCDEFTAELIDDEVKKMKQTAEQKPEDRINFGRSGGFITAQFHINTFTVHENTMSLTMPFEAILNGLANSFSQLQETVIEKIHDFVNKVKQTA